MAERVTQFNSDLAHKIEAPDTRPIEGELEKSIKGQPAAVKSWAAILYRIMHNAPRLRNGPLAVVTEIGPSGVGKTEIAKEAARYLASQSGDSRMVSGSEESIPPILRVDCGEFQREHEVSKVIGAPPGYSGQSTVPRLAQSEIDRYAISLGDKRRVTFLLFDEIEKANEALSVTLLAGLDYGVLTLGDNSKTNIKDCVVVFTSNLGNKEIQAAEKTGPKLTDQASRDVRLRAMRDHFASEQISRMGGEDGMIIFQELSKNIVDDILIGKLQKLENTYRQRGVDVHFQLTQSGAGELLEKGYSSEYGIRPLERILENEIAGKLIDIPKKGGRIPIVITAGAGGLELYRLTPQELGPVPPVNPEISTPEPKKSKFDEVLTDIFRKYFDIQKKIADVALGNAGSLPESRREKLRKDVAANRISGDMLQVFSEAYYAKKSAMSITDARRTLEGVFKALSDYALKRVEDDSSLTSEEKERKRKEILKSHEKAVRGGDPAELIVAAAKK